MVVLAFKGFLRNENHTIFGRDMAKKGGGAFDGEFTVKLDSLIFSHELIE